MLSISLMQNFAQADEIKKVILKDNNKTVITRPNAKDMSDYISVTLMSGFDQISVNKVEGTTIKFDPVLNAGIKVILFPDKKDEHWFSNITLGYAKSYSQNQITNEGYQESEQINLEVPIPMTNFTIRYDQNRYNTSIQALDSNVYLIDRTNVTAIDNTVGTSDTGVIGLNTNDTALLETLIKKYEVRYYLEKKNTYWGIFKEEVTKPWENPVAKWRDANGAPLVSIFSQSKFDSYGLAFGTQTEDMFLDKGINISKLRGSIAKSDIYLTDNYELNKVLTDYESYRYAIGAEIAYKVDFNFISKNSSLIIAGYGNYAYNDLDKKDDTSSDNSVTLGEDYQFGARIALTF